MALPFELMAGIPIHQIGHSLVDGDFLVDDLMHRLGDRQVNAKAVAELGGRAGGGDTLRHRAELGEDVVQALALGQGEADAEVAALA